MTLFKTSKLSMSGFAFPAMPLAGFLQSKYILLMPLYAITMGLDTKAIAGIFYQQPRLQRPLQYVSRVAVSEAPGPGVPDGSYYQGRSGSQLRQSPACSLKQASILRHLASHLDPDMTRTPPAKVYAWKPRDAHAARAAALLPYR